MKEGESVTNYCSRTMGIANNMRFHGEEMTNTAIVEKIIPSLTPKFDYVVCSIEGSNDIDDLSLDELQSSLLVHEQKMNRRSTMEEHALKASTNSTHSNNSRGRARARGRGRGHGERGNRYFNNNFKDNNDQSQGNGRGRDHYKSKEKRESLNFIKEKEVETLLMAIEDAKDNEAEIWYMENPTKMHLLVAKKNPSLLAKCRNLPFGGRATRDSRVHLPRKDYVRSHHQRLRKTSEKPKKTVRAGSSGCTNEVAVDRIVPRNQHLVLPSRVSQAPSRHSISTRSWVSCAAITIYKKEKKGELACLGTSQVLTDRLCPGWVGIGQAWFWAIAPHLTSPRSPDPRDISPGTTLWSTIKAGGFTLQHFLISSL
ncbi:hypothetical protein D0Y65_006098 [Glycine soja]|uniref:Retrovirus-related Pol polyprotein from transposon TNT 1-94 n=1 Tax=Glycine soja TaxID=3848 RepID=A0A445L7P0_GLYSO|nr:hypothetical protein D0Y65_006098 [Glycine soja]